MTTLTIDVLPPELIAQILTFLDVRSYRNAREAAKIFCVDSESLIALQKNILEIKKRLLSVRETANDTLQRARKIEIDLDLSSKSDLNVIHQHITELFSSCIQDLRQWNFNFDDVNLNEPPYE
jgi:hypothetical protein